MDYFDTQTAKNGHGRLFKTLDQRANCPRGGTVSLEFINHAGLRTEINAQV
jgi:hypothetical protein